MQGRLKTTVKLIVQLSILAVLSYILYILGSQLFYKLVLYPQANISVSGTGSMYPTFPKGKGLTKEEREKELVADVVMVKYPNGIDIQGKRYYKSVLGRGDIVSFDFGDKSLIKRVVGLPGDLVEIRNGLVYINNEPQKEPYTSLPHSTFGGKSIKECQAVTIPENKYMVLGDNRKESDDSRFDVGFVDDNSIDFFLPLAFQTGIWDKKWRDTSLDLEESSKTKLNPDEFTSMINDSRSQYSKALLRHKAELTTSAGIRSAEIFRTGAFEEKENGSISIADSIKRAGYWRPVYGEIPIQGYFDAQELYNYLAEFENTRKFILDDDFDEIGISVKEGSFNNCPTQIIVVHFGGYVPPNYDASTVNSWTTLLTNLKDIKPSWESAKTFGSYYENNKRDIDKMVSIINDRITKLSPIVVKMEKNEWLSEDELKYLDLDKQLSDQQEELAKKLNGS